MINETKNTADFWKLIDEMVAKHNIIIDRPKGSKHPKWDWVYECDYGYLDGTSSHDGEGIDVWVGSSPKPYADAVICIVDTIGNDSEIKILIGCTDEELEYIYNIHNKFDTMKGILIRR